MRVKNTTVVSMTQLLLTLALVVIPFALLFGPAMHYWNEHTRGAAVGYTVLIVVAVLVWQGCWDAAGGWT